MRCGDCFDLHLGYGRTLPGRLKIGGDWYILAGRNEVKFFSRKMKTYQVDLKES
ncbi:DUF5348 domain-containing protein [Anaerobacillus alkalilacustris]|uniref:DUF5348 domain-containing protein n=1 Tax=Anaerobacillus alkalilacustris TaxID=393763 RepID=UPI0014721778|nr:DUF5348 domain-containing protein [Anaerobacillus alkalilacustris]